jgi:hypothetical protein
MCGNEALIEVTASNACWQQNDIRGKAYLRGVPSIFDRDHRAAHRGWFPGQHGCSEAWDQSANAVDGVLGACKRLRLQVVGSGAVHCAVIME